MKSLIIIYTIVLTTQALHILAGYTIQSEPECSFLKCGILKYIITSITILNTALFLYYTVIFFAYRHDDKKETENLSYCRVDKT